MQHAAEWLDEHWPREELGVEWWNVVSISNLWMRDSCRCVCGQLGVAVAAHEGYRTERSSPDCRALHVVIDDADADAVAESADGVRRVELSGYALLAGDLEELLLPSAVFAMRVTRKRLNYERMSDDLFWAFSASVPDELWIREIRTRREAAAAEEKVVTR